MEQHLGPLATERAIQEKLDDFLASRFNGQSHKSLLGDVTFPDCERYWNQTEIDSPDDKPQIHGVFTDFKPRETWFAAGKLSAWEKQIATPASGVVYGYFSGRIEESVHGKLVRRFDGLDIRWQTVGPDLEEQVSNGSAWEAKRRFPLATAIRWIKSGSDYIEQIQISGDWRPIRTVATTHALWDGSKKLVTVDAILSFYIRARNSGADGEATDYLCRTVTDCLKQLFESEDRSELARFGIRNPLIKRAPVPLASIGFQTRLMLVSCQLRYLLPRLG